jgi:hypothetical protein
LDGWMDACELPNLFIPLMSARALVLAALHA